MPRQPLEHRDVGVWGLVVAGDSRVWSPGEELVVSGVREPLVVGHPETAPAGRVTEEEAPFGNHRAEERHHGSSPAGGIVAPEPPEGQPGVGHAAVGACHQTSIGSAEDLLPPHAIECDDDHSIR